MRLKLYTHISSELGLSSVTTLIVGSAAAVLVNPPLLLQDARSTILFVKSKTSNPVTAIFVSHHHAHHYFTADIMAEVFPTARLLAAPWTVSAIDRCYESQVTFWSKMLGSSSVTSSPTRPSNFNYSFFVLPTDLTSPIFILGPVQGSSSDNTLLWLPTERTIITGDAVFSRSSHVAVEEIDSAVSLAAWRLTLDLINSLDPLTIVTGHIEKGTQFDARRDMEHMYRYLDLFEEKVIRPVDDGNEAKASPQELMRAFQEAFPNCQKNLDIFLGRMVTKFGGIQQSNGDVEMDTKSKQELEGFVVAVDVP